MCFKIVQFLGELSQLSVVQLQAESGIEEETPESYRLSFLFYLCLHFSSRLSRLPMQIFFLLSLASNQSTRLLSFLGSKTFYLPRFPPSCRRKVGYAWRSPCSVTLHVIMYNLTVCQPAPGSDWLSRDNNCIFAPEYYPACAVCHKDTYYSFFPLI